MSSVLVTGGAGYIGSHAVKVLAEAGYDVVIYDNLLAGHPEAVDRLMRTFPKGRVTFVKGDVLDGALMRRTLADSRASAVMHFAALLSVADSVREPFPYYRTNVAGTMTVLEAMAAQGVTRFVFSSTCATFGEPQTPTLDETHPQKPINAYGQSKLTVEQGLPHIERAHGIRAIALRYFNAAGADPDGVVGEDHHPEEHIIPRAIRTVLAGEPLSIFGTDYPTEDGTCVRDYVHVSDLATAHVAALQRLEAGGASSNYNLGSGTGMSVRQVIDAVGRAAGAQVPFQVGPRRPGDPARLVASSARARQELGWSPRLADLDAIVETAWKWHTKYPGGYGGGSGQAQ